MMCSGCETVTADADEVGTRCDLSSGLPSSSVPNDMAHDDVGQADVRRGMAASVGDLAVVGVRVRAAPAQVALAGERVAQNRFA